MRCVEKSKGCYRRLAGSVNQNRGGVNKSSNKRVRSLHSPLDMAPFIEEETRTVGDVTYDYSNVYGWNMDK